MEVGSHCLNWCAFGGVELGGVALGGEAVASAIVASKSVPYLH